MTNISASFWNKIQALRDIIDYKLKIYSYKDFKFYSSKAKNDFLDNLISSSKQETFSNSDNTLASVDEYSNHTKNTKNSSLLSESFFDPNLLYFDKFKNSSSLSYFYKNYFSQSNIKDKSNTILTKIWNIITPFRIQICVLSPDFIHFTDLTIKKSDIVNSKLMDKFALLKARQFNLIPQDCECLYTIKSMDSENISFYLSYITKPKIYPYIIRSTCNLCCLNPFDIFSSLYILYPKLIHYTIIFQDKNSHALCHYSYGHLDFVAIAQKQVALQSYYTQIDTLGEVLYCDWSGERDYLRDFIPIESLFNAPLDVCLKILAIHHIYTKPVNTNFCNNEFYTFKNKLKFLLLSLCCILCFIIGSFFYEKYQYYNFITSQHEKYVTSISQQFDKKQAYTPMYERIYIHLLQNKDLNFHIRQEYRNTKNPYDQKWIQTLP